MAGDQNVADVVVRVFHWYFPLFCQTGPSLLFLAYFTKIIPQLFKILNILGDVCATLPAKLPRGDLCTLHAFARCKALKCIVFRHGVWYNSKQEKHLPAAGSAAKASPGKGRW
jgi:hypothetical protein